MLLLFSVVLFSLRVCVYVGDFELNHTSKWIALVVFFLLLLTPNELHSIFDNEAIKFLLWDKYCKAFGGIACSIAIIMCAYVDGKKNHRLEGFFSLLWIKSSQYDGTWNKLMIERKTKVYCFFAMMKLGMLLNESNNFRYSLKNSFNHSFIISKVFIRHVNKVIIFLFLLELFEKR